MGFQVIPPDEPDWITRPHEPGEPARHVAELSELAGFAHSRANIWRYEPGARGRRHRHATHEETFVVLSGTLSLYLGDEQERYDMWAGGIIHVEAGTALQAANHGEDDLIVYVYGAPPETEDEHVELLDPAV